MALTQASEGGLKISNEGTNGQFLQKQSGNTGGLTWADATAVGGATGLDVNDNVKIRLGTGNDLEIYHDATNTRIHNTTGDLIHRTEDQFGWYNADGSETVATFTVNGSCNLYYANSKKFETDTNGVTITGTTTCNGDVHFDGNDAGRDALWDRSNNCLHFQDNAYLKIGAGSDLQIWHDGSNSYIKDEGSGDLIIRASDQLKIQETDNGETMAVFNKDGAVELYHNDNRQLYTTSTGIIVGDADHADARIRIDHEDNTGSGGLKINAFGTASIELLSNFSGSADSGVPSGAFGLTTPHSKDIHICTAGTSRMMIGSSGQLGLSGANYGTSGQVLTSQGASSAPQWADAGGGAWEVIATHVLGSSDTFINTGWNTSYQNYKMVFTDINDSGNAFNFAIRVYMDSSHSSTGTGTLQTGADKYAYYYGSAVGTLSQNGSDSWHYLRKKSTRYWWSGEMIFPMHSWTGDHYKTWYGTYVTDGEYYNDYCRLDADDDKFIKGVKVYFDTGATNMGGRITFLRQKYS